MVAVEMRGEDGIDFVNGKRIEHHRLCAQVRLQFAHAGHVRHLVTAHHVFHFFCAFAAAAPQIHADVGVARRFQPDADATEPPHGKVAFGYDFLLNFFVEPGTPFGERAENPAFSCDFIDFTHV